MKAKIIMIISSIFLLGCTEADKLESKALSAFEKGQIDSSIYYINSAIELDNSDASKYFHRGDIYNSSKDYAAALNDVNTAIELRPNKAKYHSLKGNILSNLTRYKEALESHNVAINIRSNSKGHIGRGRVYEFLRDTVSAINDYKKATTIDSCYYLTYASLSSVYRETNELDKSINAAERGLKMYLNCTYKKHSNLEEMFYAELAHSYILKNDFENACVNLAKVNFHYKKSIEILKDRYCTSN